MAVAPALRALRLNAVELMRQPGASKPVNVTLGAEARAELELDDPRLSGDVLFEGEAVSSIDGIAVHGQVHVPWADSCRRCLDGVSGVAHAEFDELFQPEGRATDEAIPFEGDQIDLAPIVREYVLLELPDGPLCRPDCAGVFPEYGEADDHRDPRWAALEGFDPEA